MMTPENEKLLPCAHCDEYKKDAEGAFVTIGKLMRELRELRATPQPIDAEDIQHMKDVISSQGDSIYMLSKALLIGGEYKHMKSALILAEHIVDTNKPPEDR